MERISESDMEQVISTSSIQQKASFGSRGAMGVPLAENSELDPLYVNHETKITADEKHHDVLFY